MAVNNSSEPWQYNRIRESAGIFDAHNIVLTIVVNISLQILFFGLTALFRDLDKLKHVAGGISFATLALMTFLVTQTYTTRQIVVTACVVTWAFRLAIYLLCRAADSYYWNDTNRLGASSEHKWPRLVIFWTFQALWIFLTTLPVVLINSPELIPAHNPELGDNLTDADIMGLVLWSMGFLCETFADWQKFRFRQRPSNEEKFCDAGLWAWSRHPNYCGEMLQWWGIFVMYTEIIRESWMWIGICSPLFIAGILLLLSMPALEQSADDRYGQNDDYQTYKTSTSPLILMPPELYVKFPHFLQTWLLMDFPFYDYLPEDAKCKQAEQDVRPKSVRKLEMPY